MKLFFFACEQLIVLPVAIVGGIALSPFPRLKMEWLKLTLPAMISFTEESLRYLEQMNLQNDEIYCDFQFLQDDFTLQLHHINSMDE